MKKYVLNIVFLLSATLAKSAPKNRPYDDGQSRTRGQARYQNQRNAPMTYTPSFNFHASDGPRQGKMSLGGTMAQIAAGVMGGIAARNNDRTMMDIADGIGGRGKHANAG